MNDRGFVKLAKFFSNSSLLLLEETIADLYALQAAKIYPVALSGSPERTLTSILEMLETDDKEALYQVQKFLPSSDARDIFQALRPVLCDVLGVRQSRLLIDGPALFVNRPNTQRLLYKWHSEAHYYPKRRQFVNIWFPLFSRKTKENGAMSFKVGSHTCEWPFSEYTGFNKDTENKRNHFVQYEVPENFLSGFSEYVCESDPGDVYLFDRNLVHRSNENTTDRYSFAVVARAWTAENDLTLSGRMEATPYGGDIGRSGLIVRP